MGIEILRFVAALTILVYHFQNFSATGLAPNDFVPSSQPLSKYVGLIYASGFFAVQVFWCISGFIFFTNYLQSIQAKAISFRQFTWRRFTRLYPLHLLTLVAVCLLQFLYLRVHGTFWIYGNNDPYHFLQQLLFASNWWRAGGFSFNGPVWSICFEVVVYVVFFISARATNRATIFILGGIILGVAVRTVTQTYAPLATCLLLFFCGGAAAQIHRASRMSRVTRICSNYFSATLLIATALALKFIPHPLRFVDPNYILAFTIPALLVLVAWFTSAPRPVSAAILALGNLSYSSYMVQFPLQLLCVLGTSLFAIQAPFREAAFFLGFNCFVLLVSYISFRYFEAPLQSILRRQIHSL